MRLASHVTPTTFLHVEDALSIGKVRLFAGTYRKRKKAAPLLVHYLDVPDARVVFRALADGLAGYEYRAFKGTARSGEAVSCVLTVQVREGNVCLELVCGPGMLTATGAIVPMHRQPQPPPPQHVTVGLTLHQAQRLAEEALAYLHAWDVARALTHQAQRGGRYACVSDGRPERG